MAHLSTRTTDSGAKRYDVRYRDPEGRQRTRSFSRKGEATKFINTVEADKLRGRYIDPDAGKTNFKSYAESWLAAQSFDRSTREAVEIRLRLHVYPVLGAKQLRNVKPSHIQAWIRGLDALAPTHRRVVFANVSSVFKSAVDDEELLKNPCQASSVRAPKIERRKVVPWSAERALAVTEALPERYRIVATLAAGLGLRQGEALGLASDDVDFLRGKVEVRRQVKLYADGAMVFAPPKGNKTRTIPLPASVRDALAAHIAAFPVLPITLPWVDTDANEVTVGLVVTTREGNAVSRNHFNRNVWRKAQVAAKVPTTRENGCHALRHFYASVLLDAGESIKAVSEYLGHSDPGFTLRTYTHLLPSSDERTRRAIDDVLGTTGSTPLRRSGT